MATSYEVVWKNQQSEIERNSSRLTETSYTIGSLESSTLYNITVRATNVAGTTSSLPLIVSTRKSLYSDQYLIH